MFSHAFITRLKRIKPLRAAVRAIKSPISRRREQVWLLEGLERDSEQPLSMLFAGGRDNRNYMAHLLFGESWHEKHGTRVWKHRLFQHARNPRGGHDLAVLHLQEGKAPATDVAAGVFQLPCWVGGEKDLLTAADFARRSKHIQSDVRRIRKNRLGYRVTREPAEFDRFYKTMYLPHIQRLFGDRAFIMQYEEMRAAIPDCELFLITQDDQDIAGGILVYDGSDRVRGWSLGVLDGDDRWVRAGALAAFEHLQTGYLLDKGFTRLHRGGSRPFLNDGALCFKKNRGMVLTDQSPQRFILVPLSDRAGVRSFLEHNPFIYAERDALKGAVFVDQPPDSEAAARLHHDWHLAGLDGLTLFCLNAGQQGALRIQACGRIDSAGVLNPAQQRTG